MATLNFLFPRDVSSAFAGGNELAIVWVRRAMKQRRFAAAFTDVGLFLAGVALVPAVQGKPVDGGYRSALVAGGAMFAIGVPLQFSADNALSRAVWFYNQRFTR